ncbi:MAG: response regulator transcription factor [Prevotellaceae bacterium]|nr:response regulator transcription factor [Prevotellaceae bacterium]
MRPFIIADNQYITRKGIVSLLDDLSVASITVTASSHMELISELAAYPDAVVILDYVLFDFSDTQMINLKQKYKQSLWILFSENLSHNFLRQILLSGQNFSVIMKNDKEKDIISALQHAVANEIYLCDIATQILNDDIISSDIDYKLTTSERQVLHEIALGKTTKEIAFEQNLSFHTINAHRRNIFRKLEINNVHDAIKYAIRAGIIELSEYYI